MPICLLLPGSMWSPSKNQLTSTSPLVSKNGVCSKMAIYKCGKSLNYIHYSFSPFYFYFFLSWTRRFFGTLCCAAAAPRTAGQIEIVNHLVSECAILVPLPDVYSLKVQVIILPFLLQSYPTNICIKTEVLNPQHFVTSTSRAI